MNEILHFRMSGRLIMGVGALEELPGAVCQLGAASALVVTDPGLVEAGICAQVVRRLQNAGVRYGVFDGVEPDPRIEIVDQCVDKAREGGYACLIGLGGGSSIDIAKVTAVLLTNGGEVRDYVGTGKIEAPGLATVMVPTTAGTGSEVTPIAVLSDAQEHLKKGIVSDHLYPDVALIDPALSASLPPRITAYTGVDALTHAVEAYTNKHAKQFIDTFALEAIELVGLHLRRAVEHGSDLNARAGMALASLYGGLCLGSVNTAAVHALAYPLGGSFAVPHGVANALLLPYVMRFNLPSSFERFSRIAAAFGEDVRGLPAQEAAGAAPEAVARLCEDIGIISRLRDLDIPEDAIDDMAASAMKVTRLLDNNPRPVTPEDVRAIYREAY
jgi:alcohol dehydrogenase class IV